ncbi:MAG: GtrA family protein [Pseudanabaena sp.]
MNKSLFIKTKNSKFVKFLFVGVINTLFGYTIFTLLIFFRLDYRFALLIATICGVLFNFKTIGTLVFETKSNRLIVRFFAVYLLTYLLNIGSLQITNSLGINVLVAQATLLLPLAIISYFLNKRFVFNGKRK